MDTSSFPIFEKSGKKMAWVTAYSYLQAKILSEAEIDAILVGDSLAMTFAGHKDTKSATLDAMLYHTEAVIRGANGIPVIVDLPIHSYDSPEQALESAKKCIDIGAVGVKLEGGRGVIPQITLLDEEDILVVGHIGLTPQTSDSWKVRGKDETGATRILEDANMISKRGVKAVVLECIPQDLAKQITHQISVPTIGVGAGVECDAQILVFDDIIGLYYENSESEPKFVKRYSNVREVIRQSMIQFKKEVEDTKFPDDRHSYK